MGTYISRVIRALTEAKAVATIRRAVLRNTHKPPSRPKAPCEERVCILFWPFSFRAAFLRGEIITI